MRGVLPALAASVLFAGCGLLRRPPATTPTVVLSEADRQVMGADVLRASDAGMAHEIDLQAALDALLVALPSALASRISRSSTARCMR